MHCAGCGAALPAGAAFCPGCGQKVAASPAPKSETPQPKPGNNKSTNTNSCLIVVGVIGLFVLGAIVSSSSNTGGSTNSVSTPETAIVMNAASNSAAVSEETTSPWAYTQDVDKVRGTTTYYAMTTSTNSIHQDFPYESETTMTMTVRKSTAHGTDVILTISSGQMMCPSYNGCDGTVRFDNRPAERISFNGPADSSSDTIFVIGAKSFIAKLKRAKKVTIEKTLYEAGNPQFEFDVGGLKWDH